MSRRSSRSVSKGSETREVSLQRMEREPSFGDLRPMKQREVFGRKSLLLALQLQ